MRDSVSKASSAIKNGDTSAAAQSLDDVASQLDSLQEQENTDQAVASAINGLEAARQELAAQADRDARGQGAQANASGSASPGASPGAGASGNGNGNGNGNGTGTDTGSGTGTGSGNGGCGGDGGDGSGSGSGSAAPSTERGYVPGQPAPREPQNDRTPPRPRQEVRHTPCHHGS